VSNVSESAGSGDSLAVTAFRDRAAGDVAQAVGEYLTASGVTWARTAERPLDASGHVLIHPERDRWTVAVWPPFFNLLDAPLALDVSGRLGTVVSSIHVSDGGLWTHVLASRGAVVDRFASSDAFAAEDDDAGAWVGNASAVADAVGAPGEEIAPYLVRQADGGNYLAFRELWLAMGIVYPDAIEPGALYIRLDPRFSDKLPAAAEGDL
jgi:hypothetical protein